MKPQLFSLTRISSNEKTGPIPVSMTEASSCPPTCPFINGDCYGKHGPVAIHWRRLNNHLKGVSFDEFCDQIRSLPANQLWRHNQVGDMPGVGSLIDVGMARQLIAANKYKNKKGFTYTHKYESPENLAIIKEANQNGFTVNLSANSLKQADELASLECGPVVVVLPSNQTTNTVTPEGRKVVVCPATYKDNVTCASCGLCQKQRTAIVGFPAHGKRQRFINEAMAAKEVA